MKNAINVPIRLCVCRPAFYNSRTADQIFMKTGIWEFYEICWLLQVWLKSDNNNDFFLHENIHTLSRKSLNIYLNEKGLKYINGEQRGTLFILSMLLLTVIQLLR